MMTERLPISVLSAPLAAIDRRALSQAWYSALHAGANKQLPASNAGRRRVAKPAAETAHPAAQPKLQPIARRAGHAGVSPAQRRKNSPPVSASPERRVSRTTLARAIERALFEPRKQRTRATLNVGTNRVHVTIASGPEGVRLVAVCAPSIREAVARALAQARFALAARHVPCS